MRERIKSRNGLDGKDVELYGYYNELYTRHIDDVERLQKLESRIMAQETLLDLIEPYIEDIVDKDK